VTDGAFARQIITDQHAPVLLVIDCRWKAASASCSVQRAFFTPLGLRR